MTEHRDPSWDAPTTEVDTEQLLAEWFDEEAPNREPTVLAPNVIARTALTRRRSRWFVRDWWRDLFRLHQRSPLSPAPAAGLAAGVAVVLLVVLVMPRGYDIPADALVVSVNDPDRLPSITEAIEQAQDGDIVAILPGEYTENLVIDKPITLQGFGDRDEIVLRPASADEPIILIDGGDATISGFTISGPGNSVQVLDSAPIIEKMVFRDVGDQWWTYTGAGWDGFDDAAQSILVELFATPVIRQNTFEGGGEIEVRAGSDAEIIDNVLVDGAAIFLNDAGDDTIVARNDITRSGLYSIESTSCSELVIEGNTITQPDPGIAIQAVCLGGAIRGNTIDGANVGIQLIDRSSPEITGNVINTDGVALEVHEGVSPTLSGNELCGKNAIMAVLRGGEPLDLADNTICEGVPLVFE